MVAVVAEVKPAVMVMVKARDRRELRTPAEDVEEREGDTTHGKEEKERKVNPEVDVAAETQDPPAPRPMASHSVRER